MHGADNQPDCIGAHGLHCIRLLLQLYCIASRSLRCIALYIVTKQCNLLNWFALWYCTVLQCMPLVALERIGAHSLHCIELPLKLHCIALLHFHCIALLHFYCIALRYFTCNALHCFNCIFLVWFSSLHSLIAQTAAFACQVPELCATHEPF